MGICLWPYIGPSGGGLFLLSEVPLYGACLISHPSKREIRDGTERNPAEREYFRTYDVGLDLLEASREGSK